MFSPVKKAKKKHWTTSKLQLISSSIYQQIHATSDNGWYSVINKALM